MKRARLVRRLAAWGPVLLALGAALVSWLALWASADLARGRERLLAGDVPSARRAFEHASRWPPARAAARAGWVVTRAAREVTRRLLAALAERRHLLRPAPVGVAGS